jgi:probable DNA metabolism protein
MRPFEPVTYRYDGSFDGFLCCVFRSYRHHEDPICFLTPDSDEHTLYPEYIVETEPEKAARVFRSLAEKISPRAQHLVARGFLSCAPERDRMLYDFIRLGYETGPDLLRRVGDDRVVNVLGTVRHLENEAHLLKGFVRFSAFGKTLAAEIEPKNRVLPLLRAHFCTRYAGESFLIYDRTHREALLSQNGSWAILPLDGFQMAAPGQGETQYRALWRRFYDTIAIAGRENPRCRMSHMPKRYWNVMTEFQTQESSVSPSRELSPAPPRPT